MHKNCRKYQISQALKTKYSVNMVSEKCVGTVHLEKEEFSDSFQLTTFTEAVASRCCKVQGYKIYKFSKFPEKCSYWNTFEIKLQVIVNEKSQSNV